MARDVQLINCSGTIVHGDVERFIGVGLGVMIIDNTYNDMMVVGSKMGAVAPNVSQVTGNFTVDGKYSIYEIDLDTIAGAVTCTWDAQLYGLQIGFKITNNAGVYAFNLVESGGGTVDGNPVPYTTGLATNGALIVYSNGTDLKILSST